MAPRTSEGSGVETPEVYVDALEDLLVTRATLVDVREPDEYAAFRINGTHHIPLADLPDRIGEIPPDRSIYVICAKGGRSRAAVDFLLHQGLTAVNVAGGTAAWIESGRPVETGEPT